MKTRRLTHASSSLGALAAALIAPVLGSSRAPSQEPARVRDGLEFRARAAASGTLVRLGSPGRRFPMSDGLRWSPNSRQLLVLGYLEGYALLDTQNGEILTRFEGNSEVTLNGAATWTGRNTILLGGEGDETVYCEMPGAAWGEDESLSVFAGRRLVAASADGSMAILEGKTGEWLAADLRTMELSGDIPMNAQRTNWAVETAVASDGSALAAMAWGPLMPSLEVYGFEGEGSGGEPRVVVQKHGFTSSFLRACEGQDPEDVTARVTFLKEARMLAVSLGGSLALLDHASGAEVRLETASQVPIVGLDEAGAFLISLDAGGVLRSWSVPELEVVGEIDGFESSVVMRASPDGRRVAVREGAGRVRFIDVSSSGDLIALDARPKDALVDGASSVFFGSDPKELLLGTPAGEVLRVDVATLQAVEVPSRVYQLTEEVGAFVEWPRSVRIAFHDDGTRYVDKRNRGEVSRPDLVEHQAWSFRPAVSADGRAYLGQTRKGVIEFREGLTEPIALPELETPTSAALSPAGRTAAIVDGSELRIYDTKDMRLLYEGGADGIEGNDREDFQVAAIAGFLDERHIAVQYQDAAVRIVDTGGTVVSELSVPEDYSFLMDDVQPIVSQDGRWLLCTGADEGLFVFDLDSESLVLVLTGEAWAEGVMDWSLSSDGAWLAIVTDAGGVDLWDFPGFMELAQQMADGEGLAAPVGLETARDRVRHSLLAAERLRRDGKRDEAVAAYIGAEVAAPLGLDAMGARAIQRRILAGIARCGVPAEAWLAVREARAEHRVERTKFTSPIDPDLPEDSMILAHLMNPRREHQEAAHWSVRLGLQRNRPPSAGMRFLESLRTPHFRRSVSVFASADVMVALWRAVVERSGQAAGLRAQLRALDQLSLEPRGQARAALLSGFPEPGPAEKKLGGAWRALGDVLAGKDLSLSAEAARGQALVRMRDAEAAHGERLPAWCRWGAARVTSGLTFGPRDARRVQEKLEWAEAGEWTPVEEGGAAIESVLNYVFDSSERLQITEKLRAGACVLSIRARMTGDHRLIAAFGNGAVQVVCEFKGPVVHVRVVSAETGDEIFSGERLLAGPIWAPFDLSVSVNAVRTEIAVQVGDSVPIQGVVSPEAVAGRVWLILSGLEGPGELALQGYRFR